MNGSTIIVTNPNGINGPRDRGPSIPTARMAAKSITKKTAKPSAFVCHFFHMFLNNTTMTLEL
jgi:hypothetical protein